MTANRRIFLNIAATYGRSLFSLVCGLFTSRWILMSLGPVDYGLYGLVGGIIGFVTFFNSLFSLAVGRFYAFEVGRASVAADKSIAIEECRAWFSTAVFLHTVIPLVLVIIGRPLGEYAIMHWLTIPIDRLGACVWVFRFSLLSCFVGMMNVPFNAMYTAKQYIAELTIYSVSATVVRVVCLYYMVTHQGDWLVPFGLMMMLICVIPNLLIAGRAVFVFPECRLRLPAMVNWNRIKKLGGYAGWELFGMTAWTCRQNGIPVFINEYLGAAYNSSMTVSTAIAGHAMALSSCLTGAFAPAITNAHGAGNDAQMRSYAFMTSKVGTVLMLVFAIPICIELDELVRLWLKEPPPGIVPLARYVMATFVLDRLAAGQHLAVCASGRIGKYQVITSMGIFLFLPVVWALLSLGFGLHAVGAALVISFSAHTFLRAWYAAYVVDMQFRHWLSNVLLPVILMAVFSILIGLVPQAFMCQSLLRVLIVGVLSVGALAASGWFFGLNAGEKAYILNHVGHLM